MKDMSKYGVWAFYLGLVIALISGTLFSMSWMAWVLAVLGLIVGILNVTDKEVQPFLVSTIALMLSFGSLATVFGAVGGTTVVATVLSNVVVFISPAAAIVALKALYDITKSA